MADAIWILLAGAGHGPSGIASTFTAVDFEQAKQTAEGVIDAERNDEWWELVRVGCERPDDYHVMWEWWIERPLTRRVLKSRRGKAATSEQKGAGSGS